MLFGKKLTNEELNKVSGGYDFTFYDTTFTEDTKVKDLLDQYPWVADLYPDLKTAGAFGLTVGQACKIGNVSYEQLQAILTEYQGKYNADGTLITPPESEASLHF